jgi:ABC-type transport system involved in multi-copper enzyme maturation permease subunit
MLGPVLYLEMLLGSRRGKQYIFRWIYAGWLILMYSVVALIWMATPQRGSHAPPAPFTEAFLSVLLAQHFFMIVLASPAFVAGAITDEKSQGTLQYMLTADLTPAEIVLGKFLGRTAQVLTVLVLTGLPVICFCGVFGGLNFLRVAGLAAYTLFALFAVGSASILASVLTRTTREAVLNLYAIGMALLFGYGILYWLSGFIPVVAPVVGFLDTYVMSYLNPMFIPDHIWKISGPAELASELLGATLMWGLFGSGCIGLAIVLLRPAYIRQLEGEGKKKKRHWWRAQRTAVTNDPLRWKERQVEGLAPFAWLRGIPTWLGVLGVFLLACISSGLIIWSHRDSSKTFDDFYKMVMRGDFNELLVLLANIDQAGEAFRNQAMIVMLLASLVVAIRCSGTISGEREKHTWEALLLTPLETRQIVRGKLWGIIGASHPYIIAYAIPTMLLSMLGGPMALTWTLIWLGTTWLAMYYVGAAGIWCSARTKSSWRSLVGTLGLCYVGGFVLYGPLLFVVMILAYFILLFLILMDSMLHSGAAAGFGMFIQYYGVVFYFTVCLALAGLFFGVAKFFLYDAEKRIGALERTRHWEHDPDARFRRRRVAPRPVPRRPGELKDNIAN